MDYLIHHGIKGQKWYHRRYQNLDGSAPGAYPFTDIDEFFKILEKPEI